MNIYRHRPEMMWRTGVDDGALHPAKEMESGAASLRRRTVWDAIVGVDVAEKEALGRD